MLSEDQKNCRMTVVFIHPFTLKMSFKIGNCGYISGNLQGFGSKHKTPSDIYKEYNNA